MTNSRNSSDLTVLLVEDEEDTACLLKFVLEKNGYRVIHSNSGQHARSLISTMEPPDAVLLDFFLPDATGLDLLAYLRSQPEWQKTPIAILTADIENLDMRKALLLGATDCILKPVSPTRLATRLNRLLMHAPHMEARLS